MHAKASIFSRFYLKVIIETSLGRKKGAMADVLKSQEVRSPYIFYRSKSLLFSSFLPAYLSFLLM